MALLYTARRLPTVLPARAEPGRALPGFAWTWRSAHCWKSIAVGTAVADGPPRRSQRALLTHWAPALGIDVGSGIGPAMGKARLMTRRTRSSSLDALCPALRPERVSLVAFPSAGPLPSTASAASPWALFGGFAGTTGPSDFARSFISGLRPRPSLSGPPSHHQWADESWDLPVLAHGDSAHAQVLRPRGVRRRLAKTPPAMLPSAYRESVGTPDACHFGAQ
jgi:hypothetical protein